MAHWTLHSQDQYSIRQAWEPGSRGQRGTLPQSCIHTAHGAAFIGSRVLASGGRAALAEHGRWPEGCTWPARWSRVRVPGGAREWHPVPGPGSSTWLFSGLPGGRARVSGIVGPAPWPSHSIPAAAPHPALQHPWTLSFVACTMCTPMCGHVLLVPQRDLSRPQCSLSSSGLQNRGKPPAPIP